MSKIFLRIFNSIFPFADSLYILQQEEYDTRRYIKWLGRFFFRRNIQVRDHVRYTARATIVLIATVLGWLAVLGIGWWFLHSRLVLVVPLSFLWILLIPIVLGIANILLLPYYALARSRILNQARAIIARQKNLKIVTVAGSFGKTTTKNFIYQLVHYHHRTQMIPGNINTPLGIAFWIKKHFDPTTELLIVEIDGYNMGEFAASANMVPADVAIITNIGDQHLERFGNRESLTKATKEVFARSKPKATLICTSETKRYFEGSNFGDRRIVIVEDAHDSSPFSGSNRINLAFAKTAAQTLGVPERFTEDTGSTLTLPDRRQKITELYGYDAVDDSYNISFTTAKAGLAAGEELAKTKSKKLLVVTAGIPELGPDDLDKHEALGEMLSERADHLVILQSMFWKEIAKGVGDGKNYSLCKSLSSFLETAHMTFPPSEWALLLQPELTDLYYS